VNAPDLVLHADWSISGGKRRVARATLRPDGTYAVDSLSPAGDLAAEILSHARDGRRVLAGFDFPIGLPAFIATARAATQDAPDSFPGFLDALGPEGLAAFGRPAETAAEISVDRPFYPKAPGAKRRHHLVDALGAPDYAALLRRCERKTATRSAAASLFWTLGAQQVGRAAVSGWAEVIAPLRRALGAGCALWPFDGGLADCLAGARVVLAETYPAEIYARLGFGRGWSKGRMQDRRARSAAILAALHGHRAIPSAAVASVIAGGFGDPADGGDDGFDAVVGLTGMLMAIRGTLPAAAPADDVVRRWEGWILGQEPAAPPAGASAWRRAALPAPLSAEARP